MVALILLIAVSLLAIFDILPILVVAVLSALTWKTLITATKHFNEKAERWSKKLNLQGVVDSFEVNRDFSIIETRVPKEFDGRTLEEIGLKRTYDIIVLTTIKLTREKNALGMERECSFC